MKNNKVHDQLTLADFTTSDVSLKGGVWTEVGSLEVGVTEQIEIGFGMDDAEGALGRIYFDPQDATATLQGKVKIEYTDAEGTTLDNRVIEQTVDLINHGVDDYKKRMVLNRTFKVASRERKIRLLMKVPADKTLVVANSELLMSITRYAL